MTAASSAPDLSIAGLELWIDDREHPDSQEYWEGNWLRVRVRCAAAHSEVRAAGPFLHLSEIATLKAGCERLLAGEVAEAGLYCAEPNLKIELWTAPSSTVIGKIRITPDHRAEIHDYGFAADLAGVQALVVACARLLERYPLRGKAVRRAAREEDRES